MARRRMKLSLIENGTTRRVTFRKRKVSLLKKVGEISTLCGVDAFAVIYSSYEMEPATWPPPRSETEQLVRKYQGVPMMDRLKRMTDQEKYTRERVQKLKERRMNHGQSLMEMDMSYLMNEVELGKGLRNMEDLELHRLAFLIKEKMEEMYKRLNYLRQYPISLCHLPPLDANQSLGQPNQEAPGQATAGNTGNGRDGADDGCVADNHTGNDVGYVWDRWFEEVFIKYDKRNDVAAASAVPDVGSPPRSSS